MASFLRKLFRGRGFAGCGATITLDNAELCTIMVGASGVCVRVHGRRPGLLARLGGARAERKLFAEPDLAKAARTAVVLDYLHPAPDAGLEIQADVLKAFSKAVHSCASASEVVVVLNEAQKDALELNLV